MSVSVDHRRPQAFTVLAAALTVLMLMPAAVLFARVRADVAAQRDSTRLEQHGVEYLTALSPLVSALAEAQSARLSGVNGPSEAVVAAVNGVANVDLRLGEELRTTERWRDLRKRIDALPSASGGPLAVFQTHVEIADLTLALYDAVRTNARLVRDPDNDLSHLQQAVAVDLPATVVEVSRMGDLSRLVAAASAAQREQLSPQFGAAVLAVNTYVGSLTDNLQAAVDDTNSGTLSGNLVTPLDTFRKGVESLTRGANPGGAPDASTMATAQSQLQVSLSSLAGITVREMAGLLAARLDRLDNRALEALAAAAVAVLLALGAIALPFVRRRKPPAPVEVVPVDVEGLHDETRERTGALR
ncbi:hypothetical protein [Symbioplanes lichenis]|uniref:hypothetical protein n=1 Tax=Symbioplanes lichenis TaxID=1629072 RepID=UPI00273A1974|nr:hypothetical protein [Actinoplanes lichenis]